MQNTNPGALSLATYIVSMAATVMVAFVSVSRLNNPIVEVMITTGKRSFLDTRTAQLIHTCSRYDTDVWKHFYRNIIFFL